MAEHVLLLCPHWAAERQRYFGDLIDIIDVFQDYESLVEFLVFFGTSVPPYRHRLMGSSWQQQQQQEPKYTNINGQDIYLYL